MGWLSIIMLIVQYGPAIFHLVSEIIDLIKKVRHPEQQAAFTAELSAAVDTYRQTKDRRPLRDLLDRLYKHCDGDAPCPLKAV